ncbi:MAG: DedA family protein [Pseudomonadota bacterium]
MWKILMIETETTGIAAQAMAFVERNMDLAEPIVFALGFGESIALISLFIPSTVLFLGIGGLHAAAGGEFLFVWLAGAAGAFLGDIVSFAAGRFFRKDIRHMWPLSQNPQWYVVSRLFTRRRGMLGIVISKFLGAFRPFIPVVAGATGMSWPAFLIASPISCLLWAGAFLSPGYGMSWVLS